MDAGELQQLEKLLSDVTVPDTAVVKAAEARIAKVLKSPLCVPSFVHLLRHSQSASVRQLAAVLLRVKISAHWIRQTSAVKEAIKHELLQVLATENELLVVRNTAYLVAQLSKHQLQGFGSATSKASGKGGKRGSKARAAAARLMQQQQGVQQPASPADWGSGWNELLVFIVSSAESSEPRARELAMLLLFAMTESVGTCLKPHFGNLRVVYQNAMQDPVPSVRVAGLKAAGALLDFLDSDQLVCTFESWVPHMLTVLQQCVASGEEATALQVMEIIGDLADGRAKVLNNYILQCVQTLMPVVGQRDLDVGARGVALEALCNIVRSKTRLIVKLGLVEPLLHASLELCQEDVRVSQAIEASGVESWALGVVEMEGEGDDGGGGGGDLDEDEITPLQALSSGLLRAVTYHLPNALIIDPFLRACAESFQAQGAEGALRRRGGLIALFHACPGMQEVLCEGEILSQLVSQISLLVRDQFALVRSAACICLAGLAVHLGVEVAGHYHGVLAIVHPLLEDESPLVRPSACYLLEQCFELVERRLLEPLMDDIVHRLLRVASLDQPQHSATLKTFAVSALSSLMVSVPGPFVRFFPITVPVMSSLMVLEGPRLFKLRGRATEAMGTLAVALSLAEKEMGPTSGEQQQATPPLALFEPLLASTLECAMRGLAFDDAELSEYTFDLFHNFALALGPRLDPYVEDLIPVLLQGARMDDGVQTEVQDRDGVMIPKAMKQLDQDSDDDDNDNDNEEDDLSDEYDGDEYLPGVTIQHNIKTSVADAKKAACLALGYMCENVSTQGLRTHFSDIINTIFDLTHHRSEELRAGAVHALVQATLAVSRTEDMPPLTPEQQTRVREIYAANHRAVDPDKQWVPGWPAAVSLGSTTAHLVSSMTLPRLLYLIKYDMEKEVVGAACDSIGRLVNHLGPAVLNEYLDKVIKALKLLLTNKTECQRYAFEDGSEGGDSRRNFGFDQGDQEERDDADNPAEDEDNGEDADNFHLLYDSTLDLLGVVALAVGGTKLGEYLPKLLPRVLKYTETSRYSVMKCNTAVGCISEMMMALGREECTRNPVYLEQTLQLALTLLAHPDKPRQTSYFGPPISGTTHGRMVQRNAMFLFGVLFENGRDVIMSHAPTILSQGLQLLRPVFDHRASCNSALDAAVKEGQAIPTQVEDAQYVIDNACGALARVVLSVSVPPEAMTQIVPVLLNALPLRMDADENYPVFHCLFELLQANEPTLLQSLPLLIQVLARASRPVGPTRRTSSVDDIVADLTGEAREQARKMLQLLQTRHAPLMAQAGAALSAADRSSLEAVLVQ